ncbi:hypothetical protein [Sulfuriroseicoccus oceanibius]|uniref:Glycosidase n=1 Tax=Sulfuriroseicoccus oceanibius TaxID=2707525 RepID=A0A6B3L824_9BACT|nr:hypothetical protein [Sulfuriroseicoccus oceanibius]QQL45253.1 hypothetical protein G3M56_001300 [Sulfuriroseicoccus oceanibius]
MHMKTFPTPVLTRDDVPAICRELTDVTSVFNPGAAVWKGREWLMLRVQDRGRRSWLVPAERRGDGSMQVLAHAAKIRGLEKRPEQIFHVYDPRLTVLEGELMMVAAVDTDAGCRLVTSRCVSNDLSEFEMVGFDASGDRRNGVLFPEKIGGRYVRLERPNGMSLEGGPTSGDAICLATSDDLEHWELEKTVMSGRWHYWDERIGSGPPPVRLDDSLGGGWLHLYHGIATHFAGCNVYQGGVTVLDRDDPGKVVARSPMNVLEPRQPWEFMGQVPNVVFPSGMVVEADASGRIGSDAKVRVYYGAADTVVGMAEATVGQLVAECE